MGVSVKDILERARAGIRLGDGEAMALADVTDTAALVPIARVKRDAAHGQITSWSRKVFIPLTKLCRDSCHYCTFAHPPRKDERAFMSADEILAIARAGARDGCKEALFTLGDKPELRYRVAARELAEMGFATTVDYLAAMAALVAKETGLLPHVNAGVMTRAEIEALRKVSVSQGIMLETSARRLSERGGPHFGSPDKIPEVRLASIRAAGEAQVPFTSGLLIGIGETRAERVDALLKLRALHEEFGHIQEIIIQNFRAKPGTKMAHAPEPDLDEQVWTIAVTRLIFEPAMNIQSPPNLRPEALAEIVDAGVNDWGGVSRVTPDHVNPEAPWPQIERLARQTQEAGKLLVERLAIYPAHVMHAERWVDPALRGPMMAHADSAGFARPDFWVAGAGINPPSLFHASAPALSTSEIEPILKRARQGAELSQFEIVRLFAARGTEFSRVCRAADELRADLCGNDVSYVVTRNINYTNICTYKCKFCAFSKGKTSENLRGKPYDLGHDEIARRVAEAWSRGGTEVCLQGGIHPEYTGQTYLDICRAVKEAAPGMHVHAFSPLEIWQGAKTLGLSLEEFLIALKEAGLGSLPGTAAEILDDEVRAIICPDKINTAQWLEVIETAHRIGLRTTSTIMFGHVDHPRHWASHILHIRRLQARTGGFTEFVPLPFVPMETPMFLRAASRRGPTYREAILMHAVARLAFNPLIANIQGSWVKLGPQGLRDTLRAGANDLGGTLMEETITRSAGAIHGQEMAPHEMREIILSESRRPRPRTTLYEDAPEARTRASLQAPPLEPSVNTPAVKYERRAGV